MDLEEIKIRVREVVASSDVSEARAIANELSAAGAVVDGGDEPSALLRQLLFLRLPQLDPEQAAWLMQHYVLDAFTMSDFDFSHRVEDTIALVWDTDKRSDILHHFLTAVETCEQQLGDKPVVIDGIDLAPTVENWLKDYAFWPTENKFRESFDAVNYASKAPNPQNLSAEQRALLIRVLGWHDQISNTLYDYQNADELDLEEYPNLDPRLLTASLDEFESPKAVEEALEKALAVKKANPLSGIPQSSLVNQPSKYLPPVGGIVNQPRPNIQGVLSNAPIKKETVQIEKNMPVSQPTAPVAQVQSQPKPTQTTPPSKPVVPTQLPTPIPPVSSASGPAKNGVGKAPLPAKVPDNLPMVEPEDLPAIIQTKAPKQSFAKPIAPAPKAQAQSLPPTLNMDKIQAEVARKKEVAQSDIDQRLANLKKRSANKN